VGYTRQARLVPTLSSHTSSKQGKANSYAKKGNKINFMILKEYPRNIERNEVGWIVNASNNKHQKL
jgi:hypothetical protein